MSKSITETSVALTASANQFVAEFKRADNESRRSAASIDKEVDKLTKNLKRKFGVADFGKDLLRGFGIGSGFAVAQQAADLIVGFYERAAKAAQEMEASTARQLDNTKALIKLHQTDEQQLADLNKEFARAAAAMEEMQRPKFTKSGYTGGMGGRTSAGAVSKTITRGLTDEESAALNAQIELVQKLGLAREQLALKVAKAGDEQLVKIAAASSALSKYAKDYEGIDEAQARGAGALQQWNDEMERAADKYRELVDPSLRFTGQMAEVNELLRLGQLNATEAAAALTALNDAMAKEMNEPLNKLRESMFKDIDKVMEQMDDGAKAAEKAALDMGFAFQSAFEDAILSGAKFSDVLKGLAEDVLRLALRSAITAPLGNWIGGIFGGLFGGGLAASSIGAGLSGAFGGGKAAGGPVSAGTSYMVGEQGPELFTPKTSGHITPNGGKSAATYYIDARGADRTGLARLEAMIRELNGSIEPRAVGAVMDFRRRGAAA